MYILKIVFVLLFLEEVLGIFIELCLILNYKYFKIIYIRY